jgi:hypothetical protein
MRNSIPSYDELAQILSTGELESEPKPTYSGKLRIYNFKGFKLTETEKVLYSKNPVKGVGEEIFSLFRRREYPPTEYRLTISRVPHPMFNHIAGAFNIQRN